MNTCSICAETYHVSHLGDSGKCRLCEIREPAMRSKIAAEVHALGGNTFIVEQIRRGPGAFTPEYRMSYSGLMSEDNDIAHDVE